VNDDVQIYNKRNEIMVFDNPGNLLAVNSHPLTPIQETADDLYQRGWNVFPLPSAQMWQRYAEINGGKTTGKPPYILRPLFTCRMFRGETPRDQVQFHRLFANGNLGVMCGCTSNNLICIDTDDANDYPAMRRLLDQWNIPYLSQSTSRGRGSFFIRIADGEVENMQKGSVPGFPNTEIWGHSHYVVLAPSIHPLGAPYQWEQPGPPASVLPPGENLPATPIQQLSMLDLKLMKGPKKVYALNENLPDWAQCLSPKNQDILMRGVYFLGERNNQLVPLIYDIAANVRLGKIEYDDGLQGLVEVGERCEPPMYPSELRQKLDTVLNYSPEPAREYNSSKSNRRIEKNRTAAWEVAAIWYQKYNGWHSQKERDIVEAVIERARVTWLMERSELFRATRREIAELARCNQITAQKYLMFLSGRVNSDYPVILTWVSRDRRSGGYLYRFNDTFHGWDEVRAQLTQSSPLDGGSVLIARAYGSEKTPDYELDAFANDSTAYRLWKHLLEKSEPTIKSAAEACRVNYGTARNAIKRLRSRKLVVEQAGMLMGVEASEELLREVAETRNTTGRTVGRRRQHNREREWRVNRLIVRAQNKWTARYGQNQFRFASRRWGGWEEVAAYGKKLLNHE